MNRHDRRKAQKFSKELPASAALRVRDFIDAFSKAPDGADIEIRAGAAEQGPAILVSFEGTEHALLVPEAHIVAAIMEDMMYKFPDAPESRSMPNIIMGLRAGCDEAQRLHARS